MPVNLSREAAGRRQCVYYMVLTSYASELMSDTEGRRQCVYYMVLTSYASELMSGRRGHKAMCILYGLNKLYQ